MIIDPEISSRQGNILLRITNVCCIVAYCIYVMRRILIFFNQAAYIVNQYIVEFVTNIRPRWTAVRYLAWNGSDTGTGQNNIQLWGLTWGLSSPISRKFFLALLRAFSSLVQNNDGFSMAVHYLVIWMVGQKRGYFFYHHRKEKALWHIRGFDLVHTQIGRVTQTRSHYCKSAITPNCIQEKGGGG